MPTISFNGLAAGSLKTSTHNPAHIFIAPAPSASRAPAGTLPAPPVLHRCLPGCKDPASFLIQAINEREQELRQITDKLLSTGPESIDSRLDEIRLFVTKKLSDIRELLARHESADPVAVRTELRKHVSEIRMTPQPGARRPHYLAEGAWDLVGKETGPHHEAAPLSIRMVAGVRFELTTFGL